MSMLLQEYKPKSKCNGKKTNITKAKYPVFDFHTHMGKLLLGDDYENKYDTKEYLDYLYSINVVGCVNLDGFYGKELTKMICKIGDFKDKIITFIWIDIGDIDKDSFKDTTRESILQGYNQGARGVKIWKDLTLNNKIKTNDKRLDVVYETCAKLNIPVLMHIGDPKAFFDELNQYNERYEELIENPDWNFNDKDKYMTFNELMDMQEDTIKNHPDTTFVIAHAGSCAEDLEYVSSQLDKYPNMYIDIAARISELGRVPYTCREFFMKHSDRILFGTDSTPLSFENITTYFRFLETFDEYFSYQINEEIPSQGRWAIYGIGLPDDVLKKVYYENAMKILELNVIE